MLENLYRDGLLTFLVRKLKLALRLFEVNVWLCLLVSVAHRHRLVLHFDVAVGTLDAVHYHDALVLVRRVSLRLLLCENQHAGLIVVQDSDTRASVFSKQSIARRLVVQLHEEVLIRLPTFIIDYIYFHFAFSLAILESELFINCFVILACGCITILCSNVNDSSTLGMIQDFDSQSSSSLTH